MEMALLSLSLCCALVIMSVGIREKVPYHNMAGCSFEFSGCCREGKGSGDGIRLLCHNTAYISQFISLLFNVITNAYQLFSWWSRRDPQRIQSALMHRRSCDYLTRWSPQIPTLCKGDCKTWEIGSHNATWKKSETLSLTAGRPSMLRGGKRYRSATSNYMIISQ